MSSDEWLLATFSWTDSPLINDFIIVMFVILTLVGTAGVTGIITAHIMVKLMPYRVMDKLRNIRNNIPRIKLPFKCVDEMPSECHYSFGTALYDFSKDKYLSFNGDLTYKRVYYWQDAVTALFTSCVFQDSLEDSIGNTSAFLLLAPNDWKRVYYNLNDDCVMVPCKIHRHTRRMFIFERDAVHAVTDFSWTFPAKEFIREKVFDGKPVPPPNRTIREDLPPQTNGKYF